LNIAAFSKKAMVLGRQSKAGQALPTATVLIYLKNGMS